MYFKNKALSEKLSHNSYKQKHIVILALAVALVVIGIDFVGFLFAKRVVYPAVFIYISFTNKLLYLLGVGICFNLLRELIQSRFVEKFILAFSVYFLKYFFLYGVVKVGYYSFDNLYFGMETEMRVVGSVLIDTLSCIVINVLVYFQLKSTAL